MTGRSEHTTKVFVGSLPMDVTADDLRELFKPYGPIAECDIANHNRCGFLHLEDKELAMKAIEELNNLSYRGARLNVEKGIVTSRRGGDRGRGGRGRGMGGRMRDMGPYSRDGGFMRGGPPRMGGYGGRDDYNNFGNSRQDSSGGYYQRYSSGLGYTNRGPPMFDDRQGGDNFSGGNYNRGNDRYGGNMNSYGGMDDMYSRDSGNKPTTGGYNTGYGGQMSTGYGGTGTPSNTDYSGGYGDNYGARAPSNNYQTYPPVPQNRGW